MYVQAVERNSEDAMPRRKRKPHALPPQGDIGPDTPAQRAGAVILNVIEDSGAVFRRKRKDHPLEVMVVAGKISARQCAAGLKLHEAYCRTEMGPDSAFTRDFVDTSPNPSAVALAQTESITRFIAIFRHVPPAMKPVVWHVAINGKPLRAGFSRSGKEASGHCAQLQVALDLVANHLGI